jgi:hypothetical protein
MRIYYNRDILQEFSSELAILYADVAHRGLAFDERLENLRFNSDSMSYVKEIAACDFVVLPFKCEYRDARFKEALREARAARKKILAFSIDDKSDTPPLRSSEGYIFRTSILRSKQRKNEIAMPCWSKDEHDGSVIEASGMVASVGFCGLPHCGRAEVLNHLDKEETLRCDFIVRQKFGGLELAEGDSRCEFLTNIKRNLFTLCMRGNGNFSYRLYETLSMARIPIIVDTDVALPFRETVSWENHAVLVPQSKVAKVGEIVAEWFAARSAEQLVDIQRRNRLFYEQYLSPVGFVRQIPELIKTSTYSFLQRKFKGFLSWV